MEAFLAAGAHVIAPTRSNPPKLPDLHATDTSRVHAITADIGDPKSVQQLAEVVKDKYGTLDHVVSICGGFTLNGDILDSSVEELESAFRLYVVSHFAVAKYFIPLLKPVHDSSFVFITGGLGEGPFIPAASIITTTVAGLYGLILCVMEQYKDRPGPRILEQRIYELIKREAELKSGQDSGDSNSPQAFSNIAVGKVVLDSVRKDKTGEIVRIKAGILKRYS